MSIVIVGRRLLALRSTHPLRCPARSLQGICCPNVASSWSRRPPHTAASWLLTFVVWED
ncbi:hypothetical protein [Gimesia aquarii]|uniref:hypothetical protein n=1 Tax=Gimesia aquarii TaxID=2527964 RepID=UPI0018D70540|nr:hypothetical protein [Gimesia aquarii]